MSNETLQIMVYRHSVFYSPLLATIAGGFLKEEGLEARYFPKPQDRDHLEMFRKGEVHIMQAAVSTSWDPMSKGIHDIPVHFAQINQRDGFFITSRPGSRTFDWKNLEGAKLVADHAQQPFAMLKHGLHCAGVDWKSVQMINAGSPDQMDKAFREGTGDYVHLQGPAPQQLEKDRVGTIAASMGQANPPVAFSSLMAMRDFLETKKAEAFMRAYRRALQFVVESPAQKIAETGSSFFPGIASDVLTAAISRYQQLGTWRLDPAITRDQYETALDIFLFTGVFKERYAFEDVVVQPPA